MLGLAMLQYNSENPLYRVITIVVVPDVLLGDISRASDYRERCSSDTRFCGRTLATPSEYLKPGRAEGAGEWLN